MPIKTNSAIREDILINPENHAIQMKKKLSISNIDLNNLGEINYLYEECHDQVLNGLHPVSRECAIKLAAIQCFIDNGGPYRTGMDPAIHAQQLLPKEHGRGKEHDKNIIQEYKELLCEDVQQAKKQYILICTSLPTYGVTFFLVKERQSPTERRLTRRLFGVNKDCVMSVDRKTKTDFGDYSDGYYSVQTTEGETIKKLIAEYVDIILIRSRNLDSRGIEGDEGVIMLEDHVISRQALPFVVEPILDDGDRIPSSKKRMPLNGLPKPEPYRPVNNNFNNNPPQLDQPLANNPDRDNDFGATTGNFIVLN